MKKIIPILLILPLMPLSIQAKKFEKIRNFFAGGSSQKERQEQHKKGRFIVSPGINAMDFQKVEEALAKKEKKLILTMPYSPTPSATKKLPSEYQPTPARVKKLAQILSKSPDLEDLIINGFSKKNIPTFLDSFRSKSIKNVVLGGYNENDEDPEPVTKSAFAVVKQSPHLKVLKFRGYYRSGPLSITFTENPDYPVLPRYAIIQNGNKTLEGRKAWHLFPSCGR